MRFFALPRPHGSLMDSPTRSEQIRRSIDRAARFLPTQGPIDVFVAQNILQGFEEEPFEEAVVNAARMYGAQPFLPESRYREELARGRIRDEDLAAVLAADLGATGGEMLAGGRVPLRTVLLGLLRHPVRQEDDVAVRWTLSESDVIDSPETAELWHACVEAAALARPLIHHVRPPARIRDLALALEPSIDTDALVNPLLIRLCGAFLDQGVASWPMPGRGRGFLAAVVDLYADPVGPTEPWSTRLPAALAALRGMSALDVIAAELDRLGVPAARHDELIEQSLLALRGWAGMMWHFQERPDRAPVEAVPARLDEFLAIRLVCDRVAAEWIAPRFGWPGDLAGFWNELCDRHPPRPGVGSVARAFLLCQVAELVGLTANAIRNLDENELLRLERAVAAFDGVARRRLFHLAYERRHRIEVLEALAAHATQPVGPRPRPRVQAIFCMDERCESFRRHLEEEGPAFETFGTAGFFAVPMYYRGLDDWHATPLCPIVMRPRHTVVEMPEAEAMPTHRLRQAVRRQIGQLKGSVSAGSRTLLRGGLFTALGGAVAAVPLVARVAFPRLAALVSRGAADLARRRIPTRLAIERSSDGLLPDGTQAGFDVDEMAGIVRRLLEDIGLTSHFATLVAVIGHGSTSLNNPHESAYDCGACGGGRGGPNARAFAMMANDPRVRARLAAEGLVIPEATWFIAGMQDTCSDAMLFYDLVRMPEGHRAAADEFFAACAKARALDAQERCRRFGSVPLSVKPAEALRRVEARAADLAQVRPEYGHATNAICVIGRRGRTRGLFLDRRAFLVSYDPGADKDAVILARTLAAVGPVGSGINLAYLFSCIDPLAYGCGTKLPHNITGLIGVMDGHASDLRTGLPWQTVEIHEPVRLVVVIDATVAQIERALELVPAVKRLVVNRWLQLVAWDPAGADLAVHGPAGFLAYEPQGFVLPSVARSHDWFAGQRGNVPPARVLAALSTEASR
jgi:uncharacterized protein YbcC (UPF0753/DUF2309 family)